MTIVELLAKFGVTIPEDKAKEFTGEFDKEFKSSAELTAKLQEIAGKDTEIAGLKTQISDRDKDIKELKKQTGNSEELNTKLTELQTKYDTDTKALSKQLEDQRVDHAIEKFFSPVPFASELARKAAISEFREKGFKLEGDKFQGGEEFIASLKKSDPAAFKPEKPPEGEVQGSDSAAPPSAPPPQFTKPMSQTPPAGENPFNFKFSGFVRTPPAQGQNQ